MPTAVQAKDQDNRDVTCVLDQLPDNCPNCRKSGQPNFVNAALITADRPIPLFTVFRCPILTCRCFYITTYRYVGRNSQGAASYSRQGSALARFVESKLFPANISTVSPLFCTTYNQALTAEENQLDQICGPGYRKALEFLVKDYLMTYVYKADPMKQEEVKKAFLANVIEKHIDQDRIKQCAKRAAWLGNDEVHYTRKWEDKDIHDLKSLVLMTVNYIDLTIESDRYLKEMPA